MSDGNFNRSLLPHTPYQSGLKAGKSMARMTAIEAFRDYLCTEFPTLTEEEVAMHVDKFRQHLSLRIK